jgi:tetratricopeptide (TPR) repeat protein
MVLTRNALVVVAALLLAACSANAPRPAPAETAAPAAGQPLSSDDKDVMAALMAGEFAWQDGRAASAARHFGRAAAASDDPAIAEHATRVAVVAKEWELARTALARWKQLAPGARGALQSEATLALGTGQSEDANALLRELLGAGDVEGRRLVGQALLGSAAPEAALAAIEGLAAPAKVPGGVETLMMLSQVAQQLRKPELARTLAERAVADAPESSTAALWLGHVELRGGDKDAARSAFERALKLAPDDKTAHLTYAALLNDMGEPGDAAEALAGLPADDELLAARAAYAARADDPALLRRVADEIEALPPPRPVERLELLGQLAEIGKREQDALRWYREVPKGERWFDAQLRIGVLLDATEGLAAALAHLESLRAAGIEDDAHLGDTFLLEAELQTRHEDDLRAVEAYSRGLKALPDERRLLYARALLYEKLDRVDECIVDLRRIVELAPDDADALNALGYTLADRTQSFEEAHALVAKALAIAPDEPAIIDSMGWAEYRLGNLEQALVHLRRAFELQPDAEIAAHLGEVLWVSGQREEARAIWAKGREIDPDNEAITETVARLDR